MQPELFMKKIRMTYHKYDILEEKLEKLQTSASPAYPTMWEVDHYIRPNVQKYIKYILWLLKQDVTLTKEEKEVQAELRKIVYDCIDLYEPKEASYDG